MGAIVINFRPSFRFIWFTTVCIQDRDFEARKEKAILSVDSVKVGHVIVT